MNSFIRILIFSYLSFSSINLGAQTIVVKQTKINGDIIKLAQHFGDDILIKKSIKSNDEGISLFYNKNLSSGIYYIIFPDSSSFEFMYDSEYKGKINLKQLENNSIIIESAPEITLKYDEYNRTIADISEEINSNRINLKQHNLKPKEKKALIKEKIYLNYRKDSIIISLSKNYKETILGKYTKAQLKVDVPNYQPDKSIANKDSAIWVWKLNYYNRHFLDNINLSDKRLIHTPIYTSMINRFLDNITLQSPEKIKESLNLVLLKANSDSTTKKFTTNYLLNKYNRLKNSPIYETAYLYIIENYYLKANAYWVNNNDLKKLTVDFNRRKPLEITQQAPKFSMLGVNNTPVNLNSLSADYTILYFFNYDCSICNKTTPALKKLLSKYDLLNIKVLAICLGDDDTTCKNLAKKNNSVSWITVYDHTKINDIAVKYNLKYTPTLFLLDSNKRILSKNLTIEQLKNIFKSYD